MLIRSSPHSFKGKGNKTALIVLLTFITLISACTSLRNRDDGELKEFDTSVTLIAAANKDIYEQTESITITVDIVVIDMDGNKISLDRGGDTPLARYQIAVLDEQGELVPQTPEGFRLATAGRHHLLGEIDQDNPVRETFRIDTWFDLSKPGKYTLILNRPAWIPKAVKLVSNPVTFVRLP